MLRVVTSTCCGLLLSSLLFGCKSSPEPAAPTVAATPSAASSAPTPSATATAKEPEFKGTLGIVEVKRNDFPTVLTSVRTAKHEGYDRIVLEFKDRVPGYHLEYVDKPVRDCGEGQVIPLAGDSWLEIRMYPVDGHTQEGQPTIQERQRKLDLPVMLEGKQTCDFEAVVTWVLGLARPNPYRIVELKDPPRLVVDVKH
jgi:hypothetical protein